MIDKKALFTPIWTSHDLSTIEDDGNFNALVVLNCQWSPEEFLRFYNDFLALCRAHFTKQHGECVVGVEIQRHYRGSHPRSREFYGPREMVAENYDHKIWEIGEFTRDIIEGLWHTKDTFWNVHAEIAPDTSPSHTHDIATVSYHSTRPEQLHFFARGATLRDVLYQKMFTSDITRKNRRIAVVLEKTACHHLESAANMAIYRTSGGGIALPPK